MEQPAKCRVVGVRSDGSRIQIDEGLTYERARQVRLLLLNCNAFPRVEVEADGPTPPAVHPTPAPDSENSIISLTPSEIKLLLASLVCYEQAMQVEQPGTPSLVIAILRSKLLDT